MEVCDLWRKKPKSFWKSNVDLIIDNKKFLIPTSRMALKRLRQRKLRGVPRTRAEGVKRGFTKPNARKHRSNPGGYVNICAGICGDRVVLWEEVKGNWCAKRAAETYAGPIAKTLKRLRAHKKSWLILEDNDPTGYKSNLAKQTKKEHNMRVLEQPVYSPDLNPLDFSIWHAIEQRALSKATGKESVVQFKALLRRTALTLPRPLVEKAVFDIKQRAEAIFHAGGGNISCD